ncbi:MAG: hypothetical protein JXB47_04030, partial [Anaerolineae bacterium]|nr:hypothetical protein [Anaerolineae bacterium]
VLVLERGPFGRLMLRAWYLGRKRVLAILVAVIVIFLLNLLISWPFSMLGSALTSPSVTEMVDAFEAGQVFDLGRVYWPSFILGTIGSVIAQAVVTPLTTIFFTLLYYDTRLRVEPENFDAVSQERDPPDSFFSWVAPIG